MKLSLPVHAKVSRKYHCKAVAILDASLLVIRLQVLHWPSYQLPRAACTMSHIFTWQQRRHPTASVCCFCPAGGDAELQQVATAPTLAAEPSLCPAAVCMDK
ncbi:hypothetical protein cyc_02370 [Cyclospora cayetanensis]|uniref:Uncharacterized protein n=1 Tax=Cyclospora cayetanensis TaxID=88456 RepID=A0A1D3D8E9_9EIME|nr:hypothetical protein cyc_02370 [Cyclospora cayetanensis]